MSRSASPRPRPAPLPEHRLRRQAPGPGAPRADPARRAPAPRRPARWAVFKVYESDDADCSGAPADRSTVDVSRGNDTHTSTPFTPSKAGKHRWVASYSGDDDNAAVATACGDTGEHVVVRPPPLARPAIATTASGSASAGSRIRDTAHLTGGSDRPARSHSGSTVPTTIRAPPPASISCVTVSRNGNYTSGAFRPARAGTYHWVTTYSGDDANLPAGPTACADGAETVVVSKAQLRLRTAASPFVPIGRGVRDVTLLSGGSKPSVTITFRHYGSNDFTCSRAPMFTVDQTVVGKNALYPSSRFTPRAVGADLWAATYPGDKNNEPAATTCGDKVRAWWCCRDGCCSGTPRARQPASVRAAASERPENRPTTPSR
jgi:hypothetical protein